MRTVSGRVSGRTVILDEELPDGAEVEVRVVDERDLVDVTDAEWNALVEAAETAKRAHVDAETVLTALARRRHS